MFNKQTGSFAYFEEVGRRIEEYIVNDQIETFVEVGDTILKVNEPLRPQQVALLESHSKMLINHKKRLVYNRRKTN